LIAARPLSSIAFHPEARAELGRILGPAVARCRAILAEQGDLLLLTCMITEKSPRDMGGDPLPTDRLSAKDIVIHYLGRLRDKHLTRTMSVLLHPSLNELDRELRWALPSMGLALDYLNMSVQRHVAALSTLDTPDLPFLADRTEEDEAGIYTPLRSLVRAVGNCLADGASAFVSIPHSARHRLSAHERISLERLRATLTAEQIAALDAVSQNRMLSVRRIGDAARLERSSGGVIVDVDHAHVVPLPPYRETHR